MDETMMVIDQNDIRIQRAKYLSAMAMNRSGGSHLKPEDVFVVWFCKVAQNWKAIVSTASLPHPAENTGHFVEVTYDGEHHRVYIDVYHKVFKRVIENTSPNVEEWEVVAEGYI